MKLITITGILLMLFSCSKTSNAQDKEQEPKQEQNEEQDTGPKLVWEENFDGDALDETNWNFELGNGCPNVCGWGNNERQIYTKQNHQIKDGFLTITAKLEDSSYTSTRITTKDKFEFTYGSIETRAKLPIGQGIWPAFWMLGANIDEVGWPSCGEIDILEYVGKEPDMVYTTIHVPDTYGDKASSKKTKFEDIEDGFHTFKAHWTHDKIEFYVDDQLVYTYAPPHKTIKNWPFDNPAFIIVNMAVGGNFGGPEVDNGIFPQEYMVDYIKVYQD
ncbi:glycoside hydrolase family 16 protein [Galbibacter pacificus]|uniref:Glycoside hydrolase family 16 protein n=1 Tax=Galbibacter pacificus TaxID=2996052 RepID=A0ABT6FT97_9FLAO|nr:glycoside hydrolase family 16 protein [Galbibacter pacificus]MDG3583012.1 glycoside hydrolase family 16 protein [Galbibacter pacificus]MDG3586493.1 glycoside hydrolase family 16 protein [Galbibacter pacificus]